MPKKSAAVPAISICIECDQPAVWVRHTQFAGSHPYCETHAKAETDFGKDSSYLGWEDLRETAAKDNAAVEEPPSPPRIPKSKPSTPRPLIPPTDPHKCQHVWLELLDGGSILPAFWTPPRSSALQGKWYTPLHPDGIQPSELVAHFKFPDTSRAVPGTAAAAPDLSPADTSN